MNMKLVNVASPRFNVPILNNCRLNCPARKCPNQKPAQLDRTKTRSFPRFPPRIKWKIAPYKVAIKPPNINAGIFIGSQCTVSVSPCQLFGFNCFVPWQSEPKPGLAWLAAYGDFSTMCINYPFRYRKT